MRRSAKYQVAVNIGFALLKSIFLIWSIRLADSILSPAVMGAVLLFRRQGAFYGNLTQLGFSQSIVKYCGVARNGEATDSILIHMIKWVILLALVLFSISLVFNDLISQTLLGWRGERLAFWLMVYAAGIAIGYIAGSAWRSELYFERYNIVDWLNSSLVFVICLTFFGDNQSLEDMLMFLSLGTLASSLFFLLWFLVWKKSWPMVLSLPLALPWPVVRFGASRGLAAFADAGTILIGPWLLRNDPEKSGVLIISYTFVRVAQAVVLPVAQVFALRANSRFFNSSNEERRLLWLAFCSIGGATLFCILYYVFGAGLLQHWLPSSWNQVSAVLKYIVVFAPGICGFYVLRNHVDLKYTAPINLLFLALAIVMYVLADQVARTIVTDLMLVATIASCAMFSLFYIYTVVFLGYLLRDSRRSKKGFEG